MENQDKTFEVDIDNYKVKGIITPLTNEEIEQIDNIQDPKEYSGCIFNISLFSEPQIDSELFSLDKTIISIAGHEGKEIALGYLDNNSFKEIMEDSLIFRKISVAILEIMFMNRPGHFTQKNK